MSTNPIGGVGLLELRAAANALIGYAQALQAGDVVTQQYTDRLASHYVRKLEEAMEEIGA